MASLATSQRMHLCIPEKAVKVWKGTLDGWKCTHCKNKATNVLRLFLLNKSQNIKLLPDDVIHQRSRFG